MPLLPEEFIRTTLVEEYREIVYTHRFHYVGFALICIGIEFLGKCLDSAKGWHQEGLSTRHFKEAIQELMPKYAPHTKLLHSQLRSGFAHGLLPGKGIGLTHRAQSQEYQTKHLTNHQGGLILVVEDFYDDFEAACQSVITREFAPNDKMNRPLLALPSDPAIRQIENVPFNAKTTAY